MGKVLSAAEIESYRTEGYHSPLRVLTAGEAAGYRAKFEAWERSQGGAPPRQYLQKCHLLFTWANELVRNPKVLDAVEDVLGPNLLVWSSQFFNKEPHSEDYVSWHQDATYWGLSEHTEMSAWIALAPSTPESGCMRVVPGTHREQVTHKDTFAGGNMLSRGQIVQLDVDDSKVVDLVLQPGEMSLHHVLIVHGSGPNTSDQRRIGFVTRYIPTHLKQVEGPRDSALLVRGEDAYGHFELEPDPVRDFDPEMVALHKAVSERQAKILYRGTDKSPYA